LVCCIYFSYVVTFVAFCFDDFLFVLEGVGLGVVGGFVGGGGGGGSKLVLSHAIFNPLECQK
jgi:hypothetical protein